jgi:hypothetical protein
MIDSAERHETRIRQRRRELAGRVVEIPVANHNQYRTGDAGQIGGVQRPAFAAQESHKGQAIVSWLLDKALEYNRFTILRVRPPFDGVSDRVVRTSTKNAVTDAHERRFSEPFRRVGQEAQGNRRARRKTDYVNQRSAGDDSRDLLFHAGVRCGVMRLLRPPMPQQVDTDHLSARFAEEVRPASPPPAVLKGRTESMNQEYRWLLHAAIRLATPASTEERRNG